MSTELPKPIKTVWTIGYDGPEKTDIYKESDKCIWLKTTSWRDEWNGELRRRDKPQMFTTKADALLWMIDKAELHVSRMKERLSNEENRLSKLRDALLHENANPTA